jgi:REP element-mobilizing transposase RayT
MEKFNRKYRIKSARCPVWDYRSRGAYFITICTKNRMHYFGHVSDHKMILSTAGEIVFRNWASIPNHFPHVRLDAFVVMPNHFHGIVILHEKPSSVNLSSQNIKHKDRLTEEAINESNNADNDFYSRISPTNGSIPTIIRSFKSSCTREINTEIPDLNFAWQPRFYDVIIKDQKSQDRIRQYIINNPLKWKEDLFNR